MELYIIFTSGFTDSFVSFANILVVYLLKPKFLPKKYKKLNSYFGKNKKVSIIHTKLLVAIREIIVVFSGSHKKHVIFRRKTQFVIDKSRLTYSQQVHSLRKEQP
jgi:hypothetical protein